MTIDGSKQESYREILVIVSLQAKEKTLIRVKYLLGTTFKAARNRFLSFLISQMFDFFPKLYI
ncbi:hypothetical protein SAMD00079811_22130 [Scytonema sp. HK-05]|nr:hypothetical protein NIES2130_34660 [Scytonema sp. HK-05]BAY44612.1 hypothetical protein SAMD00079811_22130 [Scytonema sp. HK-05]